MGKKLTAKQEDVDARIGNSFWEARASHGRNPKFPKGDKGADMLWKACCEYFQWVEDNPLMSSEPVKYEGQGTVMEVPKMRAMLIEGLCDFIDVDPKTWYAWRKDRKDLSNVITRAERIIYQQKFTGAAANMLNPNIIARDLGLADKKELTGKDGGAIQTQSTLRVSKLSAAALEEIANLETDS